MKPYRNDSSNSILSLFKALQRKKNPIWNPLFNTNSVLKIKNWFFSMLLLFTSGKGSDIMKTVVEDCL